MQRRTAIMRWAAVVAVPEVRAMTQLIRAQMILWPVVAVTVCPAISRALLIIMAVVAELDKDWSARRAKVVKAAEWADAMAETGRTESPARAAEAAEAARTAVRPARRARAVRVSSSSVIVIRRKECS